MSRTLKFLKAMNKAFKDRGLEFGEVEFDCPLCEGKAWATRAHTPENIAHKTTMRAGCENCGISAMN